MATTSGITVDLPATSDPTRTYSANSYEDIRNKRVWIDLDNSPHIPFFLPIMEELRKRQLEIVLTARNTYQVCELLDFFGLHCKVVGRHYGTKRILKILGNTMRAFQLAPFVWSRRPDLALSHGSRAQLLVGKALRIPTVLMLDYEYASGTGVLEPDWILMPEAVSENAGMKHGRVLKYPGLKEDVYVPRFQPDPALLHQLGVRPEDLLVTLRPPATEAHYHNHESDILFAEAIKFLNRPNVKTVMLPRSANQRHALCAEWADVLASGRVTIPENAVDGLNLIWFSDLVISGGGTMNREAAALDVPVYSIFRGKIGAVDRRLAEQGRLILIESVGDIEKKIALKRWDRPAHPSARTRPALQTIVDDITMILRSGEKKAQ